MDNALLSTREAVERLGLSRAADLHNAARARRIKPVVHQLKVRRVCYWRASDIERLRVEMRQREAAENSRPFAGATTINEYAQRAGVSRQRVHQVLWPMVRDGRMAEPLLHRNWRWLDAKQVRALDRAMAK